MGKVSAFRQLLNTFSRLPGLGFLRSAASEVAEAERTGRNIEAAKNAASGAKDEMKKEETPSEKPQEETKDETQDEVKEEEVKEEPKEEE